jgi:hypothetical protein
VIEPHAPKVPETWFDFLRTCTRRSHHRTRWAGDGAWYRVPGGSLVTAEGATGSASQDFLSRRRWQSTRNGTPGRPRSQGRLSERRTQSTRANVPHGSVNLKRITHRRRWRQRHRPLGSAPALTALPGGDVRPCTDLDLTDMDAISEWLDHPNIDETDGDLGRASKSPPPKVRLAQGELRESDLLATKKQVLASSSADTPPETRPELDLMLAAIDGHLTVAGDRIGVLRTRSIGPAAQVQAESGQRARRHSSPRFSRRPSEPRRTRPEPIHTRHW